MIPNKTRILAISSNPNWFTNVGFLHNNADYEIFSSLSGINALELFGIHQPNILIVDNKLSDMNAKSFYKKIFSLKKNELPIVVVIDAFAPNFEIRKIMELGVDDFLTLSSTKKLPKVLEAQLRKRERILQNKSLPDITDSSNSVSIDLDDTRLSAKFNDYLFLDDKDNPGFYAIKDFVYITSLKDYSQIHTTHNKKITLHKTLSFWEEFLPKNKFLRIHRQTIINLDHVEKVEPSNSYRYNIFLNNIVTPFVVSQRYSQKIKNGWGVKTIK
ncbi:MAG: hypothetical protein GY936_01180 [Ignavibacteriae bacterium]|nr:hypothetical protein [Ignavibacteriota bacterium]